VHLPGGDDDVALAVRVIGPPLDRRAVPTAVLAHGAGSGAGFVVRAFGGPLVAAGWRLVAYDLRGHGGSTPVSAGGRLRIADHAADMLSVARRTGAVLLGGVSLGAHAAVSAAATRIASGQRLDAVLLVMPAWTGEPEQVAAANVLQAEELERAGVDSALDRIRRAYPGWVADELAGSWPGHDPQAFAAVLRALGGSRAPGLAELTGLRVPAAVVAMLKDPMHPAGVAQQWATALPMAALRLVTQQEVAADRAALGRQAVSALAEAAATGSR